jgi:hypothetical protein
MASLDDILTTQKNGVQGINGIVNGTNRLAGTNSNLDITAATVVKNNAGWLARIIVTVAGSTAGTAYDANSSTATTGKIFVIPNTLGITDVQFPFATGLVITPGTGQTISVSYT